jgi:hypothetical protein
VGVRGSERDEWESGLKYGAHEQSSRYNMPPLRSSDAAEVAIWWWYGCTASGSRTALFCTTCPTGAQRVVR